MIGDALMHYRLKQRLGAGAMGEVWLAEDVRLHRSVALKTLRADAPADAEAAARLLREARVASVLSHPNVATIFEVGEFEDGGRRTAFIAMEHVRGRTLAELLAADHPEPAAIVAIARQIAEALAEAHEHGIVHRDVKPGNVMVTERGHVKVLDFGLASFSPASSEESATWSGRHGPLQEALAGTVAYMAPEQLRGARVDARTDVFSLGVVLYEALAGRRPFQGATLVALVDGVLHGSPPPLPAEGPLSSALAALVSRMLERDPQRRLASMREVCLALDEIAAGRTSSAPPAHEQSVAVLSFANVSGRPEDAWLGTGIAETVTTGLGALPITIVSRERVVEILRALGAPGGGDDGAFAARVGREVGASLVVSGAYQCIGERIRVTVRVTDAASARITLNARVDGRLDAVFDVQDRIVAELASGLRGSLPPAGPRPDDTHSLEAFEAYSKGLVNLQAESPEALDRAIVFFERAVELDPGYARAHMQLGAALDLKGDYVGMPALTERALVCLDRAVALRPDSAHAWRHRGGALITVGRADEAFAAFERALAIDPTLAAAHAGIGRVHFVLRGDFARAVAAYERALTLNPKAGWTALQLANCAAYGRDFVRAERAARLAVELQQAFISGQVGLVIVGGFVRLGQTFALQGRHREALSEFDRELAFLRSAEHALRARVFIELYQRIGEAHLRLGEGDAGRAALDLALEAYERRVRSGTSEAGSPYYAACAHALLGETEDALTCLEIAAERRRLLTAARAPLEPALATLRDEPRFRAILDPALA